jgi:CO/xanthine dehydrogenase Mo-binding subunit
LCRRCPVAVGLPVEPYAATAATRRAAEKPPYVKLDATTAGYLVNDGYAPALWTAADKVIAKGKKIAAKLLEAAEADIVFADARFAVTGADRAVSLKDIARAAFQPAQLPPGFEPSLYETGTFSTKQDTCRLCVRIPAMSLDA